MKRLLASSALALVLLAPAAYAKGPIDCKLRFSMAGWSAFYKTMSGTGTITCDNGQKMNVSVEARGGGLSVGKSKLTNGTGEFSGVKDIKETLGSYATAEATAAAKKSGGVQAMTKGEVSLALAGTGEGWELGVTFGKFTISKR